MIDSDMKKITNLLYMLAVLLLASCSDFLDKSPKNTVDPETTVTDDVAIALTNACYRTLQSSNMYNQRIWTLAKNSSLIHLFHIIFLDFFCKTAYTVYVLYIQLSDQIFKENLIFSFPFPTSFYGILYPVLKQYAPGHVVGIL